jgi:hypothetical protein
MRQNVENVKKLITDMGGLQSSEMLSTIFENSLQRIGFNSKEFFDEYVQINFPAELRRELRRGGNMDNGGGFGNNGSFNFIPSAGPNGSCSSCSLTIIADGFGRNSLFHPIRYNTGRISFVKAILLLSAYWFACLKINEENLILTPDWNDEDFERNYKPIIDNYCNFNQKKVFIVEVSNGGLFLRYPYSTIEQSGEIS